MSAPILTKRQQEVVAFLDWFTTKHGFSPSTRDIQRHFGFSSQTASVSHLRALKKKGVVNWSPGRARTLTTGAVAELPHAPRTITYFFLDATTGLVKIGCCSDVSRRKRELETAFPCRLALLASFHSSEFPEKEAHCHFKADRHRGEWFRYSDAMKTFLAKATAKKKGARAK